VPRSLFVTAVMSPSHKAANFLTCRLEVYYFVTFCAVTPETHTQRPLQVQHCPTHHQTAAQKGSATETLTLTIYQIWLGRGGLVHRAAELGLRRTRQQQC
jgi:hypothetical protein